MIDHEFIWFKNRVYIFSFPIFSDIVLYQPKRLRSKFEPSELKYTDDATVYKIKEWLNNNL